MSNLRKIVWYGGYSYILMPLTLATNILLRRWLDPYEMGIINILTIMAGYSLYSNLGILSRAEIQLPYLKSSLKCKKYNDLDYYAYKSCLIGGIAFSAASLLTYFICFSATHPDIKTPLIIYTIYFLYYQLFYTTLFVLNGTTTALLVYLPLLKRIKGNYNFYIYMSAILISFVFPIVFMDINYDDIMGNAVKLPSDIKAFSEGDFKDGEFLSLIHRSTKAIGIISVFLFNPQYSILGLGFGAVFSPADFGFLRLFANFGLVGLISFYLIFRRLAYCRL